MGGGGRGFIGQSKYKAFNKLKSDSKTYWSREKLVKLDPLTNGPCETLWKGGVYQIVFTTYIYWEIPASVNPSHSVKTKIFDSGVDFINPNLLNTFIFKMSKLLDLGSQFTNKI